MAEAGIEEEVQGEADGTEQEADHEVGLPYLGEEDHWYRCEEGPEEELESPGGVGHH